MQYEQELNEVLSNFDPHELTRKDILIKFCKIQQLSEKYKIKETDDKIYHALEKLNKVYMHRGSRSEWIVNVTLKYIKIVGNWFISDFILQNTDVFDDLPKSYYIEDILFGILKDLQQNYYFKSKKPEIVAVLLFHDEINYTKFRMEFHDRHGMKFITEDEGLIDVIKTTSMQDKIKLITHFIEWCNNDEENEYNSNFYANEETLPIFMNIVRCLFDNSIYVPVTLEQEQKITEIISSWERTSYGYARLPFNMNQFIDLVKILMYVHICRKHTESYEDNNIFSIKCFIDLVSEDFIQKLFENSCMTNVIVDDCIIVNDSKYCTKMAKVDLAILLDHSHQWIPKMIEKDQQNIEIIRKIRHNFLEYMKGKTIGSFEFR